MVKDLQCSAFYSNTQQYNMRVPWLTGILVCGIGKQCSSYYSICTHGEPKGPNLDKQAQEKKTNKKIHKHDKHFSLQHNCCIRGLTLIHICNHTDFTDYLLRKSWKTFLKIVKYMNDSKSETLIKFHRAVVGKCGHLALPPRYSLLGKLIHKQLALESKCWY